MLKTHLRGWLCSVSQHVGASRSFSEAFPFLLQSVPEETLPESTEVAEQHRSAREQNTACAQRWSRRGTKTRAGLWAVREEREGAVGKGSVASAGACPSQEI